MCCVPLHIDNRVECVKTVWIICLAQWANEMVHCIYFLKEKQ
jgi:hypothetical protein